MSYTYAHQKKKENQKAGGESFVSSKKEFPLPNSIQLESPGHQVDMPVVMREKMEGAFGMDLSAVKLYENRAVGNAGAEAVTQGSRIAFAPGKLDFSSTQGQALLGHEISHVASQARGEVKGSGLVDDPALEARADREGLQAARGMSITEGYGGAATALSNASAASAAGPMQAKSGKKKIQDRARADFESAQLRSSNRDADEDEELDRQLRNEKVDKLFRLSAARLQQDEEFGLAKKNKEAELLQTYAPGRFTYYKNEKGFDDYKAQDWAEEDATDEARRLVKLSHYNYLSDEEREWMDDMFDHPTLDIMQEFTRRRKEEGERLYNYRRQLSAEHPNEDQGKLDLEAYYSPIGTNYNIYDLMRNLFLMDDTIDKQLTKEDSQDTPEKQAKAKIQKKMADLMRDANKESANKYLKTQEGKELRTRLSNKHALRLRKLSGKRKRLPYDD